MEVNFAKLHGAGNDFIIIDDMRSTMELLPAQIAALCDRHFGIGADGVILVRPSQRGECVAYMHYFNSDGSLAQMCGNGVRCFAKFLVDRGYTPASEGRCVVDTLAGPKSLSFTVDEQGRMLTATVDMGRPILAASDVPTTLCAEGETEEGESFVKDVSVPVEWGALSFTCVSMGNPHAVTFIEDFAALPDELFIDASCKSLETLDMKRIGASYEAHEVFPEKINVECAMVREGRIAMRVFERGCGETLACGTGACAVGVAAALTGRAGRENDIDLRGGTLHITWDLDGHVFMRGPAQESFFGTVIL
ncbi:MAG: diaminopimelate epimerase [Gordonibacter sp.]|nr:diaminopimelate epimerase [Gordonibacter sp.]